MSRVDLGGRHVPDILDTLAQLSNDEVPTPPKLARAMLNLLPGEVWSDPTLTWLDPFCKSGVFLREIAARLLVGLEDWEQDFTKRREHIFRNMLHGTSITQMTGIVSRRTLYGSRKANSEHSFVRFDDESGNLPFVSAKHTFGKAGTGANCDICRAPRDLERGQGRENYAYSFIHGAYPTEEMEDMKFDVIVGNPPYQIDSDGNTRTMPVYQYFVDEAISMSPRYVLMIVPSRWFAGGLGLDDFRTRMIADRRIKVLVDNPKVFDCFPGVKIRGGVNYFLWDREHDGDVEFSTRVDGVIRSAAKRDLRDGDGVLIRSNEAAAIVAKVTAQSEERLSQVVSSRIPFGASLKTSFKDFQLQSFDGAIALITGSGSGYIRSDQLERRHEWINQWKVFLPKASSGDTPMDDEGNITDVVLGEPIAVAPGSVCTDTYLVAARFNTGAEAENYAHYLATKFVRFLVLQRKVTQDLTPDRFRFVPMLDMTRRWTDGDLYEHFGLTEDERAYIEKRIKPRSVNLSLDSPIPASHLPGGAKYRPGKLDEEDEA